MTRNSNTGLHWANKVGLSNDVRPRSLSSPAKKQFKSDVKALPGTVSLLVILILAFLSAVGPVFCPNGYEHTNYASTNLPPCSEFWFGTDAVGRDLFARVCQGTRVSLLVGIIGAMLSQLIGCSIGCISGYYGGALDSIVMAGVDIGVCIPTLVYITLITLLLGNSVGTLILAISLSSWMDAARRCRSRILQFRTREFVLAAHSQGMKPGYIIGKHILPNFSGQLVVDFFTAIPGAIFSEAYLSFIGLGISSPMTSLGQLCKTGVSLYRMHPYQLWIPSAVLCVLILALYVLGNCLRDFLDPKDGGNS